MILTAYSLCAGLLEGKRLQVPSPMPGSAQPPRKPAAVYDHALADNLAAAMAPRPAAGSARGASRPVAPEHDAPHADAGPPTSHWVNDVLADPGDNPLHSFQL